MAAPGSSRNPQNETARLSVVLLALGACLNFPEDHFSREEKRNVVLSATRNFIVSLVSKTATVRQLSQQKGSEGLLDTGIFLTMANRLFSIIESDFYG